MEPLPLSAADLAVQDPKDINYRITLLNEEMQAMEVDLEAIDKYRAADDEYAVRAQELAAITTERNEVRDPAGRFCAFACKGCLTWALIVCTCSSFCRCVVNLRSCASGAWMSSWRDSTLSA